MVCIGIVGPSKTGKTSLIINLIPLLSEMHGPSDLKTGVLKHSHHRVLSLNDENKDSGRFRSAGAFLSKCVPAHVEFEDAKGPFGCCDLLIVESFRNSGVRKILYAPNTSDPEWWIPNNVVAQVGDMHPDVPKIEDSPLAIASWIQSQIHLFSISSS